MNELEKSIREALRQRAAAAPVTASAPALAARRRNATRKVALVAASAASVLAVSVAAVALDDGRRELVFPPAGPGAASDPAGPGAASDAEVPRLGFDTPGFRYQHVDDCGHSGPSEDTPVSAPADIRLQTFAASYAESPMVFLTTVAASARGSFGLVGPEHGETFSTRGQTGYASRDRGRDRGWTLSVELTDKRALYAIVVGLELDDVIPVLDGLEPRADGTWEPTVLPSGLTELDPSTSSRGCGYSATGDLDAAAPGRFELGLYYDRLDSRVADRAASTRGSIVPVTVDGVTAAFGSYRDDDHWVLFEPRPGRTMELRFSGMESAQVHEHLRHARFVDETTWQSMQPS